MTGVPGVCEYDPEHTPLPVDLSDPALPKWFGRWLQNYHRRRVLRSRLWGPLPPILQSDLQDPLTLPVSFEDQRSKERSVGPLCPQCWMPLERVGEQSCGTCPLDPMHAVSKALLAQFSPRLVTAAVLSDMAPASPKDEMQEATVAKPPPQKASTARAAPAAPALPAPIPSPGDWVKGLDLPSTLSAWLRDIDSQGFLSTYQALCHALRGAAPGFVLWDTCELKSSAFSQSEGDHGSALRLPAAALGRAS